MAQDTFPTDATKGKVAEIVQDAPSGGQDIALSLTKNLELRIKTDLALRESVDALVAELRELKDFLRIVFDHEGA